MPQLSPPILTIPPEYTTGFFDTFLFDNNIVASIPTGPWDRPALGITAEKRAPLFKSPNFKRISSTGLWPQSRMAGLEGTIGSYFSSMAWGAEAVIDYNGGGTPIFTNFGAPNPAGGYAFGSSWFWNEGGGGPGTHLANPNAEVSFTLIEWLAQGNTNYEYWQVAASDPRTGIGSLPSQFLEPINGVNFTSPVKIYSGTLLSGNAVIIGMPSFSIPAPPAPQAPADTTDASNWQQVGEMNYLVFV